MSLVSGATRDLTNTRALDVAIVDTNGDQTTTFDVNVQNFPAGSSAPGTATLTSVAISTTDTVLLASNINRRKFLIVNSSGSNLYIAYGSVASTSSFTFVIPKNGSYESEIGDFTGDIHGILQGGSGNARVTELS